MVVVRSNGSPLVTLSVPISAPKSERVARRSAHSRSSVRTHAHQSSKNPPPPPSPPPPPRTPPPPRGADDGVANARQYGATVARQRASRRPSTSASMRVTSIATNASG